MLAISHANCFYSIAVNISYVFYIVACSNSTPQQSVTLCFVSYKFFPFVHIIPKVTYQKENFISAGLLNNRLNSRSNVNMLLQLYLNRVSMEFPHTQKQGQVSCSFCSVLVIMVVGIGSYI